MNMPNDTTCEAAFLSVLMTHPAYIKHYALMVKESDFYRNANALIYDSMVRLSEAEKEVDFVSITADLRERGRLQDAGGVAAVTNIGGMIVASQNDKAKAEHYASIILECARRRDGYRVFCEAAERAVSGEDLENLLSIARENLPSMGEADKGLVDVSALTDEWALWYAENLDKGEFTGIKSGFTVLDKKTGGWQPSTLVILGARPNMGKTALALNFAVKAVKDEKKKVAIFSLEMTRRELISRIVSSEGGVNAHHANVPALMTREEDRAAQGVMEKMREWGLYIDDTYSLPVSKIMARSKRLQRERGLDLVIIDHLNYIGEDGKSENRLNEMRKITLALKGMAKELDIPVICLCQLSRGVEGRDDKRPKLSDLRESGTIEQDADVVLLLYREGYYSRDEKDNSAELIIAKHRNGEVGTIAMRFDGVHQKFAESDLAFWGRVEKGAVPL